MFNNDYSCTYIDHLNDPIQGFCLNSDCQCSQKQFCLKCIQEEDKHSKHKEDCKGFNEILGLITKNIATFSNLYKELEGLFIEVRAIYDKQLKEIDATKNKFITLQQMLEEQNYQELRESSNLSMLRFMYSLTWNNKFGLNNSYKSELLIQDPRFKNLKLLLTSFEQLKNQTPNNGGNSFLCVQQQGPDLEMSYLNQSQQLFEIGLQYMQEHEWDKADQVFKRSIDRNQQDYKTLFFYSWVLIELNKCQEAQSLLEQSLELNRNLSIDLLNWCGWEKNTSFNSVLTIAQAYALELNDNQEKAILLYDQAINYDKRQTCAYARKATLLVKFKIYDAALETLNEGLKITYNKAFIHYCKGIALFESQQLNEALNSFKIASQFDPNFGLNNFNVGNILRTQQKLQDALIYMDSAIKSDPNLLKAYTGKSLILCEMKKYDLALDCLEEVLKINPNYEKAYHLRGNCLKQQRKFQEAIQQLDKAIALDNKYVNAYTLKGNCLSQLKQYSKALQCYDQALQIDKQCIEVYINKGILLQDLKKFKEAIEQYDLALRIDPNCPLAYKNKGVILETMKKFEEAIICYQLAIELGDADSDQIKKWIGSIKVKKGISWIFGY
ncbi:unnamed protein product (macronuclear) [Paramecium tetraurelia]|uniref:Uncharacterized protein n=1 Tax=Paramecium tetraurelia TaxID=5888 RepID=A0CEI1_PARTE|nr:uncharacterized protein GSPATT00037636001 [Paramecium tetraurelia]CAK69198.1 unnamed protein product [Paramecium tetraurelia]|eukprot:XP_001436595.1 hypothetical protein (macronuclear) [Paramecium tetraurelia strain d4-2]